jgi:hypothetical protein
MDQNVIAFHSFENVLTGNKTEPHVFRVCRSSFNINCSEFLGTNIDSSLSWKNHITALLIKQGMLCNGGNKTLYVIRCNEDGLPLLLAFGIMLLLV